MDQLSDLSTSYATQGILNLQLLGYISLPSYNGTERLLPSAPWSCGSQQGRWQAPRVNLLHTLPQPFCTWPSHSLTPVHLLNSLLHLHALLHFLPLPYNSSLAASRPGTGNFLLDSPPTSVVRSWQEVASCNDHEFPLTTAIMTAGIVVAKWRSSCKFLS